MRDEDHLYEIVAVLVEVAKAYDVSPAQAALSWLLSRPAVTSAVIGARTADQLADNLKAADFVLPDADRARLDKVSAPPLTYPYWHQAKTAADRLGAADLALLGPHVGG